MDFLRLLRDDLRAVHIQVRPDPLAK